MIASFVTALVLLYAPTRDIGTQLDAAGEARVTRLGKQLRCAVCQGESITDSPASMAQAQLAKVRELVSEGKSDEEVLAYFSARYGEWILLEPTKEGLNVVLWVAPLAVLLMGLGVILLQPKRTSAPTSPPAASPEPSSSDDAALLAQVRADTERRS